ncbi:MAG TPA: hypothetical protein VM283_07965, partial [Armatimonadota bacterium]|nr:hypothetical protein [Armatimonadota bacterium]
MAAAGNVADEVLRVEPKYFDADATMVARMGPVGDTPFTVSVFPPHRRVVGEVVSALVEVQTERDVALARIRARGSEGLQLVGVKPDGVIFEGPLTAEQETQQTVRMRAERPGPQSLMLRLRSSNPEVETDLRVDLGDFENEVSPEQIYISLDLRERPVSEAVQSIARASGMQVRVVATLPDDRVTKDFSAGVPALAALRIVVEEVGWQVRDSGNLHIVERQPE